MTSPLQSAFSQAACLVKLLAFPQYLVYKRPSLCASTLGLFSFGFNICISTVQGLPIQACPEGTTLCTLG